MRVEFGAAGSARPEPATVSFAQVKAYETAVARMVELQLPPYVKIIASHARRFARFHVVVFLAQHDNIHVVRRVENEVSANLKPVVAPVVAALGNYKTPPFGVGVGKIQYRIFHAAHPSAAVQVERAAGGVDRHRLYNRHRVIIQPPNPVEYYIGGRRNFGGHFASVGQPPTVGKIQILGGIVKIIGIRIHLLGKSAGNGGKRNRRRNNAQKQINEFHKLSVIRVKFYSGYERNSDMLINL